MRRFISITFFLCLLLSLQAQEVYTTKNIPKVHLQDKTRYVCNPAGILSTEACDNIDRMLYALEQQTGIETVVAVVPSIESLNVSVAAGILIYEAVKQRNND